MSESLEVIVPGDRLTAEFTVESVHYDLGWVMGTSTVGKSTFMVPLSAIRLRVDAPDAPPPQILRLETLAVIERLRDKRERIDSELEEATARLKHLEMLEEVAASAAERPLRTQLSMGKRSKLYGRLLHVAMQDGLAKEDLVERLMFEASK